MRDGQFKRLATRGPARLGDRGAPQGRADHSVAWWLGPACPSCWKHGRRPAGSLGDTRLRPVSPVLPAPLPHLHPSASGRQKKPCTPHHHPNTTLARPQACSWPAHAPPFLPVRPRSTTANRATDCLTRAPSGLVPRYSKYPQLKLFHCISSSSAMDSNDPGPADFPQTPSKPSDWARSSHRRIDSSNT